MVERKRETVKERERERERKRERSEREKQMCQNCMPTMNVNNLWVDVTEPNENKNFPFV